MENHQAFNSRKRDRLLFFQEFLKNPVQIASLIPSSGFLEQRILKSAAIASATRIVELGPGTGGTTRAILRAMPKHAHLLSIERNPQFHAWLNRINDERLTSHLGNALELKEITFSYGMQAPEVVISGIPFTALNDSEGVQIIEAIASLLAPNGRFVAYQLSKRVASLCKPILGPGRMMVELLNIPPMRVYQWQKTWGRAD